MKSFFHLSEGDTTMWGEITAYTADGLVEKFMSYNDNLSETIGQLFHFLCGQTFLFYFCYLLIQLYSTMSISSYLLQLKYGSYEESQKASVYEALADTFKVSPQHIYEIAHGKKPRTPEDFNIFRELVVMGIIVYKWILNSIRQQIASNW